MNSKIGQPWLPFSRIESLVQLEPALLLLGLAVVAWLIRRLFLRSISEERHKTLKRNFRSLAVHLLTTAALFILYAALSQFLDRFPAQYPALNRFSSYLGFFTLLSGAIVFVKVFRILTFEYFYLSHMKVPFPLLLVNIFTLLLVMAMAGWIASEVFGVRLAPLLATSAIFSLIVGLALQDTLGNLFAGVALQFDKSYEIGDWIEIYVNGQKVIGQVQEISWRATVLVAVTEETISVPNRIMGQTQIFNYSTKTRPILRGHTFRIQYGSSIDEVKKLLINAALAIPGVRKLPPPFVFVTEPAESWVALRLLFYIDDFGTHWGINDRVLSHALQALETAGVELATNRMVIEKQEQIETVSER